MGRGDTQQPILLVDDNKVDRRIVRCQLENMGWSNITIVENGQEAVEAVKGGTYPIILMDVMMGGIEATRIIRALNIQPSPRIIALTASATPEQREECLEAGMDFHVCKPVQREELEAALREVLPKIN